MARRAIAVLLSLTLVWAVASRAGAAVVRTVQFEQKPRLKGYDIRRMVTVHPGDEYSPGLMERNRRLLEATGLFRSVEAEARESKGDVAIFFTVAPHEVIDKVAVTGNFLILKKDLERVITMSEGEQFAAEKARRTAAAVLRLYESEGYSGTTVRTEADHTAKGVRVTFVVTEGKPGVLRSAAFSGNDSFGHDEIVGLLRLTLFTFFSNDELTDSAERLERFYREKGFLDVIVTPEVVRGEGVVPPGFNLVNPIKALVTLLPGQYDVVDVTFRIAEGTRYRIGLAGNESFTDADLTARLTFAETGFFDEHEAETSRKRILSFYLDRGYYEAEVAVAVDIEEGTVDYDIKEGRRFTVDEVVFEGNVFFSRDDLLDRTRTWTQTVAGERLLRRDYLVEDRRRLRDHYLGEGFIDVQVDEADTWFEGGAGQAVVVYRIAEGPRAVIESIVFEGVSAVPREALIEEIKSSESDPFRLGWISSDKERILRLVSREGYPECRVKEKVLFSEDRSRVELIFQVDEGPLRRVGKVVVVGGRKTRPRVVLRDFPLKPGDPYSGGAVVEGRRNLYGLGYFQRVSTSIPEPVEGAGEQDIVIRVLERPTGSVRFGGGYSSEERFRGFVEIGEQNLLGTGRSTSLRLLVGTLERRYDLFFREPWPFGYEINSEMNIFEEFRKEKGYDTIRRGVSLGVKREFLERFDLNLKYRFEFVDYENVELAFENPEEAARELEDLDRTNISSIIATLSYDRRDDPVKPHSGSYHIVGVEVASDLLGGNTAFNKYSFETSWYLPLTVRSETALGLRGGFSQKIEPFNELPLSERFFLGGPRGVRGYPEDEVGPKDDAGNPIGGDAYALAIAEYRFPLLKKRWRGVLFFDIGNVWANLIEPVGPKSAVGAGLRYTTPVGPLRLDYGLKINPDEGEPPGRLHFSIGFPF